MAPLHSSSRALVGLAAFLLLACASGQGADASDTESPGLGSDDAASAALASSEDATVTPIDSADSGHGTPVCGNGQVEPGEDCDDANDDDTDACTRQCAAPSCDDGLRSGDESDVDCGGGCVPCPTGSTCGTGLDCETAVCSEGTCAFPASCRALLDAVPGTRDGVATIDPDGEGGVEPFAVSCDMSTDGGGWIRLSLQHSDGVVVGQHGADNPWHKCSDDGAKHFSWIDEGTISADVSPGATFDEEIALGYQNPADGTIYTAAQMEALRAVVTELSSSTRMVAMTADDDSGDWDATMTGPGHEIYARGASGEWTLLTPGTNGNCGGSTDWPLAGSESAFYLWTHDPGSSAVDGTTGLAALSGLRGDVLPSAVRLVVQTGGGVAFGWEQPVFLVR